MAEIKTLHGFDLADTTARKNIAAVEAAIPTKTSDIENDTGYMTELKFTSDGAGTITLTLDSTTLVNGNEVEW